MPASLILVSALSILTAATLALTCIVALLQNRRWVRRGDYHHRRHIRHWRNF